MKNSIKIKRLVGMAILTALVIVFQLLSNYLPPIGTITFTLALVPIAVGAILYGPLAGAFLGAVMGVLAATAPSTLAYFMPVNPAATIILCLLKTAVAGFLAGWLYRAIAFFAKNKENAKKRGIIAGAAIAATVVVPIVNTFIFVVGASIFFGSVYKADSFSTAFPIIFLGVFGPNFAVEATISILLSPAVVTVLKIVTKNYNLGFANDFSALVEDEDENLEVEVA